MNYLRLQGIPPLSLWLQHPLTYSCLQRILPLNLNWFQPRDGQLSNRPQPPNIAYHHTTEPTVIFTQAPEVPPKPFDFIEYATKKAIDVMFEGVKSPAQQFPAPTQDQHTQDQIGALQRRYEQIGDTRRRQAEQEQRRQEERKAEEKKQEEERAKKSAEDQKRLTQLGEDVRKLGDDIDRSIQTGNIEVVNIFQKCTVDNAKRELEFVRATHDGIMKQQELKDAHEAVQFAAATDEIRWFRETGKKVDDMMYRQPPKTPQTFAEQFPTVRTYGFIRNEVHEEMQRRVASDRKKRNQEIIVRAIEAIMILGKEIVKNRNGQTR